MNVILQYIIIIIIKKLIKVFKIKKKRFKKDISKMQNIVNKLYIGGIILGYFGIAVSFPIVSVATLPVTLLIGICSYVLCIGSIWFIKTKFWFWKT